MATKEGKLLFAQFFESLTMNASHGGMMSEMELTPEMMQMMGGFTVLRMTSLMSVGGLKTTKEQLLALNAQLNKIKKP